jgi:hypothetical protein
MGDAPFRQRLVPNLRHIGDEDPDSRLRLVDLKLEQQRHVHFAFVRGLFRCLASRKTCECVSSPTYEGGQEGQAEEQVVGGRIPFGCHLDGGLSRRSQWS